MSQAAVSFGIRGLERSLGVTLFVRDHRIVRLTELGQRFFHDVSIGLGQIEQSVTAIQRMQADRHVTLSVSTAFASLWMLPRLASFRAAHPGIDLRFLATDRDVDVASERISFGIWRGDGGWSGYETAFFAPERIYPVCSPAYLKGVLDSAPRRRDRVGLAELARLNLIYLDEPHRYRPSWSEWFAAAGHPFTDSGEGLRLNDYALIVQATLEGQGVALGWDHLVESLVARGSLVRPVEEEWKTGIGFWLVSAGRLSAEADAVRSWLLDPATHALLTTAEAPARLRPRAGRRA
jgi:DNA-binding transcriptional LysR family regulator